MSTIARNPGLLSFTFLVTSSASLGATINVPADQPTIQAGINAAVSGADEVVVASGTYNELINFNGKAITVRSTDPTDPAVAAATIIDGGASGPVVTCSSGEMSATVLDGFTITNGSATDGGGMYNAGASPTVTNCTFNGNSADNRGGGMWNDFAIPTVTGCTFNGNTAINSGGGMYNNGTSPTVTNCTFNGNSAGNGGGMWNDFAIPTVSGCTFNGNTAINSGGGMFNSNSSPTVINCTFSGNSAFAAGGGMSNNGGSPAVTNCTFSRNTTGNFGFGGGMLHSGGIGSGPTVTNCIFWENADSGGMDESAQIHVVSDVPIVNYSDIQGGWTGAGGTGNLNADPLFVNAAGGDLRLSSGSSCIDAGDNSVVTATKDAIGQPRKAEDFSTVDTGVGTPPIVDMGAYEFVHPGDADGDGDVDADDFLTFSNCINGSLNPPKPNCLNPNLDLDGDGDIDASDFLTFSSCFNGSLNPPTCP